MPKRRENDRRQVYSAILQRLATKAEFTVDEIPTESKGQRQVARTIIRELVKSGVLQTEANPHEERYRWSQSGPTFDLDEWVNRQIYGSQIKLAPAADRPRERLIQYGAAQLRTAELLAVLIRSGRKGESAVQAAEKIVARLGDRLDLLRDLGRRELHEMSSAISEPAFCQIQAGIELGRRVAAAAEAARQRRVRINNPGQAIEYCLREYPLLAREAKQEEFHVITLDTKHQPIGRHLVTVGTLKNSLVHPREVFRHAIRDAANSILILHNHPSGDPTPSEQDLAVTKRLEEVGEIVGISVIDHIVIAGQSAVSIQEWRCNG